MSVIEANTLDMAAVLVQAYEVGDMIKSSVEMADYLYWKQRKDSDPEAQKLLALFSKKRKRHSRIASGSAIFTRTITRLWKRSRKCRTFWMKSNP